MAAYLALRRRAELQRGQPCVRVVRRGSTFSKQRGYGAIADILELGLIIVVLLVSVNVLYIMSDASVFPNAACPVLVDAGITSGVVGMGWASNKFHSRTIPHFDLLPRQRTVAKLLMAAFVALAVVAIGTGIVACWGLFANIVGQPAEAVEELLHFHPLDPELNGALSNIGAAIAAFFIAHVFAIIGVMVCGETMGKRRRAWYQEYLDWLARRELSG